MKKHAGIWIDHRTAIIVSIVDGAEHIEHVASGLKEHERFSGQSAGADGAADDQRDRKFTAHLGKYYDGVIAHVHDADAIFVFGPGEAKGEFGKHLAAKGLGARVTGIETADKMTDPQIAAKVRLHYQQQARGLV